MVGESPRGAEGRVSTASQPLLGGQVIHRSSIGILCGINYLGGHYHTINEQRIKLLCPGVRTANIMVTIS